ncbi:MAG: hypothetical protein KAT49_03775 [Methanomicrobia archaeon]|nr:hypothetical protein [Methanomicrobia archaeon]
MLEDFYIHLKTEKGLKERTVRDYIKLYVTGVIITQKGSQVIHQKLFIWEDLLLNRVY